MKTLRLINNDSIICTPTLAILEAFINESIVKQSVTGAFALPVSTTELDALIERKKPILSNLFNINLTKNKRDKSRDYICQMLLELDGGYQTLKSKWALSYNQVIEALIEYIDLPDVIYVTFDYEDTAYMCINPSLDLSYGKNGWNCSHLIESPEEMNDYWAILPEKEYHALQEIYGIAQMVVGTGEAYFGYGDADQDIEIMKKHHNYKFIGDKFSYHSFHSSTEAVVLMMTKTKDITGFIDHLTKKLSKL